MRFDALLDKVVVITGASSGIGKCAVEAFLNEGARVVLAARSEADMQQHLEELGVKADHAIVVKTDVSDYNQVKNLAQQAKDHFGRIDVWINNAASSVYGAVEQLTAEEISRIIDVVLKGQLYGMKAALEVFKEQRYGNIINVSSALGKGSAPFQSAYVAAKHGIVGFSSVLREELMAEGQHDIDVSVLMPSSIDTPFFIHAKSKLGVRPYPIPPIYHPQLVAEALVKCAKHPRPEMVVGGFGKTMVWAYRLAPWLLEKYMARTAVRQQISDLPKPMEGDDNLYEPMLGTNVIKGGYGTTSEHIRDYPKKHPIQSAVVLSIPVLLGWWLLRRVRLA